MRGDIARHSGAAMEGMLQLVGRYTPVDSEDDNGVRVARYERSIAGSRGDRYNELYLGLNYYWYGHKLKLQKGARFRARCASSRQGAPFSTRREASTSCDGCVVNL